MSHTCTKHAPGNRQCHTDHGCDCPACLSASYLYSKRNRLRAMRGEGNQPPHGVRRRLQALMRRGWSLTELGRRLGRSKSAMTALLTGVTYVQWATHTAVAALYDELWDQEPDRTHRDAKRAATRAQRRAEREGWPPAAAWDDDMGPHGIDNPAATPYDCASDGRRAYGTLLDAIADAAHQGRTATETAAALGIQRDTVYATCRRHDELDLWERLTRQEAS